MSEDSGSRATDVNEWLRLLFMLLYAAVIFYVIKLIVTVILIIQFVSRLITGSSLERLRTFSAQVSAYGYQILQYVSYNSDDKPFPLSDWPTGRPLEEAPEAPAAPQSTPPQPADTEQSARSSEPSEGDTSQDSASNDKPG